MYCLICAREFGKVIAHPCSHFPDHNSPIGGLLTAEEIASDAQRRLRGEVHPLFGTATPDGENNSGRPIPHTPSKEPLESKARGDYCERRSRS